MGNILNVQLLGGQPSATAILGVSLGLRPQPLLLGPLGPLHLDASAMVTVAVPLDGFGFGGLSTAIPASTQGHTAYFQAASTDLANALAVRFTR